MVQISVRNVSKYYKLYASRKAVLTKLLMGDKPASKHQAEAVWAALTDINIDVETGHCVGLIGRNGSGKSTLLRILAGITAPSAGHVSVNGKLSTVLDVQSGLHPRLSGIQNIYLKGAIHGLSKAQVKDNLDRIVDFSGLENYINNPIQTYSTGMIIRLGFSIAMHMDFDILLMDEVLSVGDIVFQRQCLAKVKAFLKEGKTIILATHNLGDVAAICERVIFLKKGRIQHDGSCENVLKNYWDACEKAQKSIPRSLHPFNPENIYGTDTHEVEIQQVTFTNGNGKETDTFHTGDQMDISIKFHCERTVQDPVFRVQFFQNNGTLVHGSNTGRVGLATGDLLGDGEITLSYERINLLEGDYYISVGIWPDEYRSTMTDIAFDCHQWAYIVRIKSQERYGGGIVFNPFSWQLRKNNGQSIIDKENS